MSAPHEIWILGATGRTGVAIARKLADRPLSLVLVGRDEARLQDVARTLPGSPRIVVAKTFEATLAELSRSSAAVVMNTVGPFASTAIPVVRACPKGTHYVDLSNELLGVIALLGLNDEAVSASKCLVTGAGYGFVGTESIVRKLCEGRPPPARVRVDAVPIITDDGSTVGEALAATLVDTLAAGGYRYDEGKLVRTPAGSHAESLTLPEGARVITGSVPTGDLEAARRASGAPSVIAGSSEIPITPLSRLVLPMLSALMRWRPVRNWAVRRLAPVRVSLPRHERRASWGHARVEWSDGTVREGWLRAGEGMVFTASVAAEVVARLARQEGKPGAWTPGALFGVELATAAGAELTIDGVE